MPSGNWSFPCSPRNPAKVREELRLLATLIPAWRLRGTPWSPRSGAQLEFGRQLRQMAFVPSPQSPVPSRRSKGPWTQDPGLGTGDAERSEAGAGLPALPGEEDPTQLRFRTQADALTDENLRWTARARFGTYKFFGFVATDRAGYAQLTPAGERFITSSRPGEVLLRQLLKWQYPDNQHRGRRWPADDFAIFPFVATARLIHELGGLTRQEIGRFCFTMRRTEDAAAMAEAIRQFRQRQSRRAGRRRQGGKRITSAHGVAARAAGYGIEGRRVALGSMNDYADALIRYFRYTGLFSVRGARIVVASGREAELDELIFDEPAAAQAGAPDISPTPPARPTPSDHPVQLALGEAPPVRLAAPRPLFPHYDDAAAFYQHYGDAAQPRLPWEDPQRLAAMARALDTYVAELRAREVMLRTGRSILSGPILGEHLPDDYESLIALVDRLRRTRFRLQSAMDAAESRTPQRLQEALAFYRAILAREVIDPPTFLEWNTWRVFLALGQAREIVPHLALDDDLQPLHTAQGNQPDLEVDYGDFLLVVEVTLRTGADQRQAEARPVTRHILEAQRRYNGWSQALREAREAPAGPAGGGGSATGASPPSPKNHGGGGERPVFGLFVAPKIHPDTVTDFLVALKYRVIERQQIAAIPLTLHQLTAALRPFGGGPQFTPQRWRTFLETCLRAGLEAEIGEDWLNGIEVALRHWLASLGVAPPEREIGAAPVPLPLFP